MRSATLIITNGRKGLLEASYEGKFNIIMKEVEKIAAEKELDVKQSKHLRLLTEETICMLPEILEYGSGTFWIESSYQQFRIHIRVTLDTSGDITIPIGRSAEGQGMLKRICAIFGETVEALKKSKERWDKSVAVWSLSGYIDNLKQDDRAKDLDGWDELEMSIIANLADDVVISTVGSDVEIVVKKVFI